MADFSLNVKINGADQVITTVGQIEQALVDTRNELKNVAIGSDAFSKLSEQAQNLQREFVNSYKETTNFQKGIAELGQSMGSLASSVTAGFTIATTAFSMFGSETEKLSETQIKAQQALSLALAATTLATNAKTIAEDINNVGLALQNGLTKALTATIGAEAIATAGQAVAAGTATVAQRALNAAMAANPIGLVLAAVGALVGALFLLGGEEKKTYTYTRDLNDALDANTESIKNNLDVQKELATLEGRLAEAMAKTEMGKLEAKISTQKKLDEINRKEVEADVNNTNAKIANQQKMLQGGAGYVEQMMAQTKNLQDFNLESRLSAEEKEYYSLINRKNMNLITEQEYADAVVEVYKRYFHTKDEDRKKDFDAQVATYDKLKSQRDKLNGDLKIANETQTNNDKLAEIQRQQQREEDYKKYKENLKKRKDDLKDYNDDVKKLDEDRAKRQLDAQRALDDFINERVSLVQTSIEIEGESYKVYNEDLIAGYDETLRKISTARVRDQEDAIAAFNKEIEAFTETQKKRVDNNNKRVISDKTIQDEVDKRNTAFYGRMNQDEGELFDRQQIFKEELILVEEDKKAKIIEIDQTLKRELTYGDNNMNDSRKKLSADELAFKVQMAQRELELQKGTILQQFADRMNADDEEKKAKIQSQIELLKAIQELQRQQREAARKAEIEALNIQKAQDLISVQGTEEQKGIQRQRIIDQYKKKESDINTNFALTEKEADKKNQDDILSYRLAQLQKYADLAAQIANTILGLAAAITEGNKIESENQLRDMRDSVANQTSALNEGYNAQRAALDEKLAAGIISQEQYNSQISGLDKGLAASTDKINKEYKAKELAEKKKAFESDKKLKIAQAVISGIQGALSAFTGAMQLGPIAGPIVGAILAALVVGTTAVQVSNIKKTQFDGGVPEITPPNTGGSANAAAQAVNEASTGGFTGFNQGLVGTPTGTGAQFSPITAPSNQRVYVVESDITNAQRRVSTLESNASFG